MNAAQSLHRRWSELLLEGGGASKEEVDWTTNELRNSLRSIEWDLEDLDETINILNQGHHKSLQGHQRSLLGSKTGNHQRSHHRSLQGLRVTTEVIAGVTPKVTVGFRPGVTRSLTRVIAGLSRGHTWGLR